MPKYLGGVVLWCIFVLSITIQAGRLKKRTPETQLCNGEEKMTTQQIGEITKVLNEGTFNYVYSGRTPHAQAMQDYLSTLNEGTFTKTEVEEQVNNQKEEIEEAIENDSTIDPINIAIMFIADPVAQRKVKCMYEGVTFTF